MLPIARVDLSLQRCDLNSGRPSVDPAQRIPDAKAFAAILRPFVELEMACDHGPQPLRRAPIDADVLGHFIKCETVPSFGQGMDQLQHAVELGHASFHLTIPFISMNSSAVLRRFKDSERTKFQLVDLF